MRGERVEDLNVLWGEEDSPRERRARKGIGRWNTMVGNGHNLYSGEPGGG